MDVAFTEENRFLIVKITGEMDHHTCLGLKEKIDTRFADSGAKHMIFDLADVGFMDSSGVGVIIGRYREIERGGGKVYAVNVNGILDKLFDISGLKKIVTCCANVAEVTRNAGCI